jgi:3-dehydroquinate synthase class II
MKRLILTSSGLMRRSLVGRHEVDQRPPVALESDADEAVVHAMA